MTKTPKTRPAQIAALAEALAMVKRYATTVHGKEYDPEFLAFAEECYHSALATCTYADVRARATAAYARAFTWGLS